MEDNLIKQRSIEIDLTTQRLILREGDTVLMDTLVSTAGKGAGERIGSECTPRGWHVIHEKVGTGCDADTVFVGRQPTGEIYSPALSAQHPDRDWILTRIMWLSGLEEGLNKSGNVDTQQRYVYIHGSPDEVRMGKPGSHGCIRMRNDDIISLYDLVDVGTRVLIRES